ncbi:hypothetical protein FRB93_009420 [Tulasnella sp. JGI-2019a]|nr:hypothetical protein FRB93_009420 [Tulasnella sp. JGI-2019a]
MGVSLITLTLPLIFIAGRLALPLNEAPDGNAPVEQVPVSKMPSLTTLAFGKILNDSGKILYNGVEVQSTYLSVLGPASEVALKDLLSDRYPNDFDPASRARKARLMFSYFKGGKPIQTYLEAYRPKGNSGYIIPSMESSPEMVKEMQNWLDQESSPPAIFMIEKYSGMTTKELFLPASDTPNMWTLSPFWVSVVRIFGLTKQKALATLILGMDLDHAQLTATLSHEWYSKFADKELARSWHAQMMDPVPARRVRAFESFGALPQTANGMDPQMWIICSIIGTGWSIEHKKFTEDQIVKLRKAIFLLSNLDSSYLTSQGESTEPTGKYVQDLKARFNLLTWEHRVNIRLLVLLTSTQERWDGLRRGITEGDISFFVNGPKNPSTGEAQQA